MSELADEMVQGSCPARLLFCGPLLYYITGRPWPCALPEGHDSAGLPGVDPVSDLAAGHRHECRSLGGTLLAAWYGPGDVTMELSS